ncbi:MAG: YggS family pyridoxal phosphate-dependent enzyme, partial [Lachnospiraceae bacterium]|nr:YggS family pyridoxal phosphate-dependent enzyme [Lachnospiraceae bacterium]
MNNIEHNLEVINNKIADASKGRKVTLVAVSKTKSCEDILVAYDTGQRLFGENRMQELRGKIDELKK